VLTRPVPVWARWLALAALVVAAWSAGRFSAPRETLTEIAERTVYRDRVVEHRVEVQTAARVETRVVYRDRVTTPDGTVTEHEVERTAAAEEHHGEVQTARSAVTEATVAHHEVTRVTLQPDWRIGVTAGAALVHPALSLYGPVVVGLEVDRRIVGGVSAGVWASSVGAAGVALAVEF
jgi:hypothetical protein